MGWSYNGDLVEHLKHWSENLEALGKVIEVLANPKMAEKHGHVFLENASALGHVIDDYTRTIYLSMFEAKRKSRTSAELRQVKTQDDLEGLPLGKLLLFKGEPEEDLKHWGENVEALGRAIIALAKSGGIGECEDVLIQFGEALGRMIYDYAKEISTTVFEVERKERASVQPGIGAEAQSDPEGSEHKNRISKDQ